MLTSKHMQGAMAKSAATPPCEITWSLGSRTIAEACPLCSSREALPIGGRRDDALLFPDTWHFAECRDCKSIYLIDRPDDASLHQAYDSYYTHEREPDALAREHGVALAGRLINGYLNRRYRMRRKSALSIGHILFMLIPPLRMGVDVYARHVPERLLKPTTRLLDYGCPRELLFVGRLVEKKGLRHLLDAMPMVVAKHPGTTLTIAGFGPELEERMAQARHLGIADKVRFLGAVTHDKLPELYRRAAALVAPFIPARSGDREGLGLVSVEALACGCPVVTTAIEPVRELFDGQWPPYLAQPANPESLAAQIIQLLDDHEQSLRWASATRHQVVQRFGWHAVARSYIAELACSSADGRDPGGAP